jgi:PAS domain S-box-containing protein
MKKTDKRTAAGIESDDMFRLLADKSPNMIFINKAGKIVYVNEKCVEVMGYGREEFYSDSFDFLTLIAPESIDLVKKNYRLHMEGKEVPPYEYRLITKKGRTLDAIHTTSLINIEGEPAILGIVTDITERKRAETELRESEKKYHSVISNIPTVTWTSSRDGGTIFISPNIQKVYGYTQQEVYQSGEKLWFGRIHPEDLEEVQISYHDLFAKGGKFDIEYRIKRKDGEWIWLHDRAVTTYESDGVQYAYGVFYDITERKAVEDSLERSQQILKSVLDSMDAVVYVTDISSHEILYVNKYTRDIFGDVEGKICWQTLQSDQSGPCEFCTNDKLLTPEGKPKGVFRWEFQNTVNGKLYDIRDRAIRWIDGRTVRLEIATDVTERRKLEEELARGHVLESVGMLAGGIAHDFNNLLTAVMNNIYLSKMHIDSDSKAYSILDTAERGLLRAGDLTRQLLTFSRGGAPVRKATSVNDLIRDSADFALRGSNVRCEYVCADDLWTAQVDAGQISQVIHNLVLNADQAMPDGGVIKIQLTNSTIGSNSGVPLQEGRYIRITIQDQGTGIADEDVSKIFDPFYTTKEMGRGLGLAITYSIIKSHSGYISVESRPGKGTTFTVYLPAADLNVYREAQNEEDTVVGKGRILIMDDEAMVRQSLRETLKTTGYVVEFAKNGDEAVELYEQARQSSQPFDCVILDLTVPGGPGGKETIKRLRDMDSEIKAVVSSGYSNDPVMADYRKYGFKGVIAKPYRIPELNNILQRVMKGQT